MERKKHWKDFQTLVKERPSYRAWMNCKDPEEKAMRDDLMWLIFKMGAYDTSLRRIPMPEQIDDMYLYRTSSHMDQRATLSLFLQALFENSLRQGSDENLNLIFSFLDAYIALLRTECALCEQQNPPEK